MDSLCRVIQEIVDINEAHIITGTAAQQSTSDLTIGGGAISTLAENINQFIENLQSSITQVIAATTKRQNSTLSMVATTEQTNLLALSKLCM